MSVTPGATDNPPATAENSNNAGGTRVALEGSTGKDAGAGDQSEFTFDLNQQPEEVRSVLEPVYKQMQGAWTKKTQELSNLRKQTEEKAAEIEAESEIVERVQSLLNTPEWQLFIHKRESGELDGESTPRSRKSSRTDDFDVDDDSDAADRLDGKVLEITKAYDRKFSELTNALATMQAQMFAANTPDWSKYKGRINSILKTRPGISLTEAYKLAKAPDLSRQVRDLESKIEALTKQQGIDGSTERPSSPTLSSAKPSIGSFQDAVNAAVAELGELDEDPTLFQ